MLLGKSGFLTPQLFVYHCFPLWSICCPFPVLCFPAWGLGGWSLLGTPWCLSGLSCMGLPGWKWGEALLLYSFLILSFCLPLLSYTFPLSSFLSLFLCHRCAHGCRKHPSTGSSTERTSSFLAFRAVPAVCPSHGYQLPSFAATLTINPFSSLSPIMSLNFFLSLCLMTQPSLCYCPGRSVSHLQPVAPLASLSCKPKYSF